MLLSKKHRFIFIHIYKNAGTSITTALTPFASNQLLQLANWAAKKFNVYLKAGPEPFHVHARAREIIDAIGKEQFGSYFSFAFVRNPWDWQVSLYKFMLKNTAHPQHTLIKSMGNFENYIEWRCEKEVRLQKDFIYSVDGELLVDYVGRYENLHADFDEICSRIGITATLPRLNVSNTKPYQEFYNEQTKERVRRTFDADITLFGYEF